MNDIIRAIEKEQMKKTAPQFDIGDTVKVWVKVIEGTRERLQAFEGIVIAKKNGSVRETFTVRRVSFGVGTERVFPIHSPKIDRVEIIRKGAVRRAKLYYLRERTGKAAKVEEKIVIVKKDEKEKKKKEAASEESKKVAVSKAPNRKEKRAVARKAPKVEKTEKAEAPAVEAEATEQVKE